MVQDSLSNLSRAWTFFRANVLEAVQPAVTSTIDAAAEGLAEFGRLTGNLLRTLQQIDDLNIVWRGDMLLANLVEIFHGVF